MYVSAKYIFPPFAGSNTQSLPVNYSPLEFGFRQINAVKQTKAKRQILRAAFHEVAMTLVAFLTGGWHLGKKKNKNQPELTGIHLTQKSFLWQFVQWEILNRKWEAWGHESPLFSWRSTLKSPAHAPAAPGKDTACHPCYSLQNNQCVFIFQMCTALRFSSYNYCPLSNWK